MDQLAMFKQFMTQYQQKMDSKGRVALTGRIPTSVQKQLVYSPLHQAAATAGARHTRQRSINNARRTRKLLRGRR
jgi:hypothetical protein